MDVGNKCNQQIWKWYYDATAGHCYQFSYSGCHGNNNNFETSKSCLHLCASVGNSIDKIPYISMLLTLTNKNFTNLLTDIL